MTNIKKIVSVLFSAILLFSATATNSIAIELVVVAENNRIAENNTETIFLMFVIIFPLLS